MAIGYRARPKTYCSHTCFSVRATTPEEAPPSSEKVVSLGQVVSCGTTGNIQEYIPTDQAG